MDFITIALLSIALAMDAFSVSISCGMSNEDMKRQTCLVLAGLFGIFQLAMPLIGYLACLNFKQYLEHYTGIIGFIILLIIGCRMMADSFKKKKEETKRGINLSQMFVLAVATSIDALAVGVTFAAYSMKEVLFAVGSIGLTAFLLSFTGIFIGKKIGSAFDKAEVAGGIILIIIGVKLLIESGIF